MLIIPTAQCVVATLGVLKSHNLALAGIAQLVGVSSQTPEGSGFDPGQGIYPGCKFDPWLGCMWKASECFFLHECFSFSLWVSVSLFLCLSL